MSRSPPLAESSNPASPSHSVHNADISLETLVSHLLASKRSLSSINSVWQANEIVTSARNALEESVALNARTAFLRNGIGKQVILLQQVRSGIEGVYEEGQKDFKNVIRTLDAANARLEATMNGLRSTLVEAAFRPKTEEPRSLLDFVDEQGVEAMRDTLKESIRESKEAQTEFDSSILAFEDDLRALKASMKSAASPTVSQSGNFTSPIPAHLQALEANAQEMASLLDSLVSHFDLCVNAIKHTEGGYAAVRKAASSQPPDAEPVSVSGVMKTEHDNQDDQPISEEERREMLDVLQKDAEQVEDVVIEIREFLTEMEQKHEAVLEYVTGLTNSYNSTLATFQLLESISARLPGYMIASQDFRLRWEETKISIHEQLAELESMRLFYENYHSSYDGLLLEVWRRRQTEEKVKNIMRKAMEQVDRVLQVDHEERAAFRSDFGEYLPVDLWSGVNSNPPMWDFVKKAVVGEEGVEEANLESVPELEKSVVEAAHRRDRARQKAER